MLRFGRDQTFFDLLNGQAEVAVEAGKVLQVLISDLPHFAEHAARLNQIEGKGDELTHQLQNRISGTFITPLDQEDLSALSHVLDDITDFIEATASRVQIYRLTEVRPDLKALVDKLAEVTGVVVLAVAELRGNFARSKTLRETLVKIHTIENDSDEIFRSSLMHLFDDKAMAPIDVMKWKEIYDRVEMAVDRCEDVAKLLDNMIVKYA